MKDPHLSDLTSHCVRCGFCLEACPTFRETADERNSPRGRIYLVRLANEGQVDWREDVAPHLDQCLGCRACEPACPSGVQYGQILELARDHLETVRPQPVELGLLNAMTNPTVFALQTRLAGLLPGRKVPAPVSELLAGQPAEATIPAAQSPDPWPPLELGDLPPVRGEVLFLEGCVMGTLFPAVHEASKRLLRRVGFVARRLPSACCGALHAHSGFLDEASRRARDLVASCPPNLPVVVNSAGCGSTMKEYGHLDANLAGFGSRVVDLSEFLLAQGLTDRLAIAPGLRVTATYHDACHLAHGQRVTQPPRHLLDAVPGLRLVPLPEVDLCCGSAGIYNVRQPAMARRLLERKWRNVESTLAEVVVLGNPGCHAWIAQAAREHGGRVRVLHTAELLEAAFVGFRPEG